MCCIISGKGFAQCEGTFTKTLSVHYSYIPNTALGGGGEAGFTADEIPLSVYVGCDFHYTKGRAGFKLPGGDSTDMNARLYTKFGWRIIRYDYRLSLNAACILGFDNLGGHVATGLKVFMPVDRVAFSLEPYYLWGRHQYLVQMGLHFKFN